MNGKNYKASIGRVEVEYRKEYGDGSCVMVRCVDGWNDSCKTLEHRLSLEEVHDLRYMLERMLISACRP